jgi:hypothetical protein
MGLRLVLLGALAAGLTMVLPARVSACVQDSDCKGKRVCFEGSCKRLTAAESLLRVDLTEPIDTAATLFVDERYMGELPWSGIVAAGQHAIRVEAYGRLPVAFQGESRGGMADTISVTLEPDPAFSAPIIQPAPAPQHQPAPPPEKDDDDRPGMISLALFGGGGYGTAQFGGSKKMRPSLTYLGGAALGVRVLDEPIWIDLTYAMSYLAFQLKDPPWVDEDDLQGSWSKPEPGLTFALQGRLLFPIKENFFYIGAELEPGYIYSSARWAYAHLHLALSLFFNEYVEARINPLGGSYMQELTGDGFIAGFHATLGLAVRFLNP